ncbi:unnamed protein product [Rotaria sordida]|uniref:Choline/carnitine acyltransferase domain-containing protein n=2 Tax=Rotaria sordida TaxID=392033 RepID=A0A819KZM9_9BILA|nr:unnamed protein product [Rotaria sordida]CAF3954571.1 unnamed protein product [Rotaria sordida]
MIIIIKVNILEKSGQLLLDEKITPITKYLYEDLNKEENKYLVGHFTVDKQIDSAIMLICLDNDDPSKLNKSLSKVQRMEYILGKYLCNNLLNRWYDKSFNMTMVSDGTLDLHCEHTWNDDVTLLRFL